MPVHIVFEAKCNYHRPLAHFLLSQRFHLELIPSLAVARTREAMHTSWDKNDLKDAQVLSHLLRTGVTQRYNDLLVNHTHDFQELSLTYAGLDGKDPHAASPPDSLLASLLPEIERHYHASRSL